MGQVQAGHGGRGLRDGQGTPIQADTQQLLTGRILCATFRHMTNYRNVDSLRELEIVLKAAGDPTRTRILKLLQQGELCVCQVQVVLALAPSTISKHLSILRMADLVEDRRDGKWTSFRLAASGRNAFADSVLLLLRESLDDDETIASDAARLRKIREIPVTRLCSTSPRRTRLESPRRSRGKLRRGAVEHV